jgi:hypothetical protein
MAKIVYPNKTDKLKLKALRPVPFVASPRIVGDDEDPRKLQVR